MNDPTDQQPAEPLSAADLRSAALYVAAPFLVLYGFTASRTIYAGDCGELATAAAVLGVPHPTGYPLYVLVGHLWQLLLPLGNVAFELSLMSAFFGALAAGALYVAARSWGAAAAPALFAALLFGASPTLWGEATAQRVYTLSIFVILAQLAAFGVWRSGGRWRWLALAYALGGLGTTNHTVAAIATACVGVANLAHCGRDWGGLRRSAAAMAAFFPPLLLYAYLPIASAADPPLDWGNPETLDNFLAVLSRDGYWVKAWLRSSADAAILAAHLAGVATRELGWIGLPLALLGIPAAARRGAPVLLPVLLTVAVFGVMAKHGSWADLFMWPRYYLPAFAGLFLLLPFGVERAFEVLPVRLRPLLWAVPASMALSGPVLRNQSDYRVLEGFHRALLGSLPQGATLVAGGDNMLFPLMYLRHVEGVRPDVSLAYRGITGQSWVAPGDAVEAGSLFSTQPDTPLPRGMEWAPLGPYYVAMAAGSPPPEPVEIPLPEPRSRRFAREDFLTRNFLGDVHFTSAVAWEARDWPRAATALRRAVELDRESEGIAYNAGIVFARNGQFAEAEEAFERALVLYTTLAEATQRQALTRPFTAAAGVERMKLLRRAEEQLLAQWRSEGGGEGLAEGSPEWHRAAGEFFGRKRVGELERAMLKRAELAEAGVPLSAPPPPPARW
ncbi:MAG: DUF2723 domain-containing protein [Candidatus Sumerlaeia bacterium]|nr:DUF2723 domain-containing protein [Candidatus Sumerlaeia bacterium]